MKKIILVLIAFFLSGCTAVYNVKVPVINQIIPQSAYERVKTYEIDIPKGEFYNYEGVKLLVVDSHNTGAGCSFNWESSIPFLYLNPDYLKRFPKEFQWFVFFHEVGHHTMRHTDYVPDDTMSDNEYEEFRAGLEIEVTMFSLYILHRDFEYSDEEFDIVFYYMHQELDSDIVDFMEEFRKQGFNPPE